MLNSKVFDFSFFLGAKEKVESLEEGAKRYGGATLQRDGSIYSNVPGDEYIKMYEGDNKIAIYIPSTIDINTTIDNVPYVAETIRKLESRYDLNNIRFYNTKGTWYSDTLNEVIVEKITVVEVLLSKMNELDIRFFINIANWLKDELKQEGVSLEINDALAIV